MNRTLDVSTAGELLRNVVEIADTYGLLADRRQALLETVARLVQADSGHWAWGRGRLDDERRLGVGFIPYGYTEDETKALMQFALDAEVQAALHQLLQDHVRRYPRDDGVWSVTLAESLAANNYPPDNWIVQRVRKIGVAHWMQGGRDLPNSTFAVVVLGRREGGQPFGPAEKALVELAISSIPWLWPGAGETVPQEALDALSPRQRAVMFQLLDGLSRKKIAARLGIGEETVNTHMKAIFKHFGVQSATELAALFLRGV